MKFAILALRCCCDYSQIGGAESVVRRLALGLGETGHTVDYILYGDSGRETIFVNQQVSVYYCETFDEALDLLGRGYDHVITVQIAPLDRLRFAWFQIKHRRKLKFHKLMLGTPKSFVRWLVCLSEAVLNTHGGQVITISSNTARVLSRLRVKHKLLLPPIPEAYLLQDGRKPKDIITFTHMGRLDPEKGSHKALELFERLRSLDGITTRVFGYRWNENRDHLTIETHVNGRVSIQEKPTDNLYSPEIERDVIRLLHETDILVLPYKSMLGTIDPPVLLLEAMAAGCVCLVCPSGNVGHVYGASEFVLNYETFVEEGLSLAQQIRKEPDVLNNEISRVKARVMELRFDLKSITGQLVNSLQ